MSVRRVAAGAEEESTNGQVANTGTRTWAGQVQGSSGRRTGHHDDKNDLFWRGWVNIASEDSTYRIRTGRGTGVTSGPGSALWKDLPMVHDHDVGGSPPWRTHATLF